LNAVCTATPLEQTETCAWEGHSSLRVPEQ